MAQIVFNHVGCKSPHFDGTCFVYWKRKIKIYMGSINDQVWEVTENDFVILDPTNLTNNDKANKQCNTMSLNTLYNPNDSKVFEQIKDCERESEAWKRLEESYKGTPVVKSAKLYILKDRLTSFKMKDDESIPEMFHRLQVIVNDLKVLGEKVQDDDFSHRFLMCLHPRFETLRLIIIRGGLKDITPNHVLGDVITQETYCVEREGVDQEDNKDDDKKKKSVAFKASTSSKIKSKSKKEESSDDEDTSDKDDEAMSLFVCKFGKLMKKGYGARKRRDNYKNKDQVRRCFRCNSKDHNLVDCPYNSDNEEDEKKEKNEKKEKKEKKMSFKKKKGGSYVVI
ncbi:uncharacterized protein [Miscanthus floridulus]|uniref:uncharacterized protein n=1 Tax=Miscanthus floridulus TaxID=154761 RepID=UPI003457BB30